MVSGLMIDRATAYAPGSTSNVGPGFDCLGIAITGLGDRVSAQRAAAAGVRVRSVTDPRIPLEADRNTAALAATEVLKRAQEVSPDTMVIMITAFGTIESGIEAALDRAQALVVSTGARSYQPQICIERARLAALCSDAGLTQQNLQEAHRLFIQMGAGGHAMRLAPELATSVT